MKNIGVVGYGIVGKSVIRFLKKQNNFGAKQIILFDERVLSSDERASLESLKVVIPQEKITFEQFASQCDIIISSPGFKVPHQFKKYCVTELDLFCQHYKKKVIGVTGTVGKTTIVSLAQKLLSSDGERFLAAGNIGKPMLDVCFQSEQSDGVVLELSSFQLENVKKADCGVAVMVNCFPNHLDRHGTFEEYFKAKLTLIKRTPSTGSIITTDELFYHDLFQNFWQKKVKNLKTSSIKNEVPRLILVAQSRNYLGWNNFYGDSLHIEEGLIVLHTWKQGIIVDSFSLVDVSDLSEITFTMNWLFVIAMLHEHGLHPNEIKRRLMAFAVQGLGEHHHHRLELCHSYQGIDVYNDSKSTVIQSTKAAIDQLFKKGRRIHLILGGLDKGVDRAPLVEFIKRRSHLLQVYYFGGAQALFDQAGYIHKKSLEAVIATVIKNAQFNDLILFSPSGASFDMFSDYKERGKRFVELIKTLAL